MGDALDGIPEALARLIDNVVVVVEDGAPQRAAARAATRASR